MNVSSTALQDPDAAIPVAAIVDDGAVDVDRLLREFAFSLQARGVAVRGLVMTRGGPDLSCATDMVLVDIDTREEFLVSQPMGSGSTSCRVDPRGFAAASRVLRAAAQADPDLVICDRFGGLEAAGEGFSAELLALMSAGIPVLTVVSAQRLQAWRDFTGGTTLLAAEPAAIEAWVAGQRSARTRVAATGSV